MFNFFKKKKNILDSSKKKRHFNFSNILKSIFSNSNRYQSKEEILSKLLDILIISDMGYELSCSIINDIKKEKIFHYNDIIYFIKNKLNNILSTSYNENLHNLYNNKKTLFLLVVGSNGTGKTTACIKLANFFKKQNKKVLVVAGDTFRSAAKEQLEVLGKNNNIDIFSLKNINDSAAIMFDAFHYAQNNNIDIVIGDTAGRSLNNINLMLELKKIKKIINKINSDAPHEILINLDATHGTSAIKQLQIFHKYLVVNSIILSKIDSIAKAGFLFPMTKKYNIPVKFLGIGEKISNIEVFNREQFIERFF